MTVASNNDRRMCMGYLSSLANDNDRVCETSGMVREPAPHCQPLTRPFDRSSPFTDTAYATTKLVS
jgi:hypothetical protein